MNEQTDCKKCIYYVELMQTVVHHEGNRMWTGLDNVPTCTQQLRMTRPICPLFDDGKEVKQ